MNPATVRLASRSLALLGVIFGAAMAFGVLSTNVALFAAAVCFILSGGIHSLERS